MPQQPFTLNYVPALDGLRGFAVLIVMYFHADARNLSGGFIGVDLFFVLSGFLITALLLQEYDRRGSVNLKHFYLRRALRLGPALLLMLAVFCLGSLLFLEWEQARRHLGEALVALFYMANWARAFDFYPTDFLGHTWSLSIEEQFYLLWPLTLLLAIRFTHNRRQLAFAALALALLSWGLRSWYTWGDVSLMRTYNGLDSRLDMLMLGCTLGILTASGLLAERTGRWLARWRWPVALLVVLGLLALVIRADWTHPQMYYWGFTTTALLTLLLILDVTSNPRSLLARLLTLRWLVWTGTISYGLYLWHFPIYRTLVTAGVTGPTMIVLGTLATFIVATASYYAMERPLLRLKQRFGGHGRTDQADHSG